MKQMKARAMKNSANLVTGIMAEIKRRYASSGLTFTNFGEVTMLRKLFWLHVDADPFYRHEYCHLRAMIEEEWPENKQVIMVEEEVWRDLNKFRDELELNRMDVWFFH